MSAEKCPVCGLTLDSHVLDAFLSDEMQDVDNDALERAKGIFVTDPTVRRCDRCEEEHSFCAMVDETGHRLGWLRVTINDEPAEDDE